MFKHFVNRTFIASTILLLIACNVYAQQNDENWDIQDYFEHLPDSCFNLCDWRDTSENGIGNSGIKTLDIKNGFISFKRHSDEEDFFQIALFKGNIGQNFIAVSTRECESCCCFTPTSYFYRYEDSEWYDAVTQIMPDINTHLFFNNSAHYNILDEYGSYFSFDYILPQYGTVIKVELVICDYLPEEENVTMDQCEKLVEEKKTLLLEWDSSQNRFSLKEYE